ncbi:hypothetical protein [Leptotrichia massiliensis]|nr:hypothetical protein [Leptotrichia massiliensis]
MHCRRYSHLENAGRIAAERCVKCYEGDDEIYYCKDKYGNRIY